MGFEPSLVNSNSVKPFQASSPNAVEFERRREVISRAILVGELTERVDPAGFLAWAQGRRLEVPKELEAALAPSPDNGLEESKTIIVERDLREQVASLTLKIAELKNASDVHPRRLRSMQVLIAGMAVSNSYGFRPTLKRNDATAKIKGDILRIGLDLNEDTIRAILREATQLDGIIWPSDEGR